MAGHGDRLDTKLLAADLTLVIAEFVIRRFDHNYNIIGFVPGLVKVLGFGFNSEGPRLLPQNESNTNFKIVILSSMLLYFLQFVNTTQYPFV